MSISRVVVRGTTRILAGSLVARVLDFAFFLMLARALGVDGFGLFSFATSYTLLFGVLADLGVTTVVTRDAARAALDRRRLLADALGLKIALALVSLAGAALVAQLPALSGKGALETIVWLTLAVILNSAAVLFEGFLKVAGRAGAVGLAVVTRSAVNLGCALLFVRLGLGVRGASLSCVVAAVAHLLVAIGLCRGVWAAPAAPAAPDRGVWIANPLVARERAAALLRDALPLALSSAFIGVYFRVDSVLLQAFKGQEAVGLYGGIYRFFEAFTLIAAAYHSVVFPYMARAADGPSEALRVLWRKSFRAHLLVSLGAAVFVTLEAHRLVVAVLGPPYASGALGLAVLVWAVPGSLLAATLFNLLVALNRHHAAARAVGITAAFNVALNLALIPRWSLLGASVATVASEVVCFALLLRAFGATVPRLDLGGIAWRPAVAAAALGGVLAVLGRFVPIGTLGLLIALAVTAVVYPALLAALRAVGREDAELLLDSIPSRLRPRR